jgi:hypothetical protein
LWRFDEERRQAIGVELQKLLVAEFITEFFHPTWLPNPVLVRKKNGIVEDVCRLYQFE